VAGSVVAYILSTVVEIVYWLIIVRWAMSLFRPSRPPAWFDRLEEVAFRVTEPLLAPVRRYMPDTGPIDFSPLVVILGLWLLQRIILSLAAR
jgi:YggT family protein